MKKQRTKKWKRWMTAAIVAAVIALTIPIGLAINYVGTTAIAGNTNNGLIGAAYTDVDNLFIYMMNQALPVGSIYMTETTSTVAGMVSKYGGTWEVWGTGRTPAGVNPGGSVPSVLGSSNTIPNSTATYQSRYPAQLPDIATHGTMNLARSASFTPTFSLTGTGLSLTDGNLSMTVPGSITWDNTPSITWPGGATISATSTLMTVPLFSHTHSYSIIRPPTASFPTGNSGWTSFFTGSGVRDITWGNAGTVASGTQISVSFPMGLSNWTAVSPSPVISYTGLSLTYTRQYFTATSSTVTPSLGANLSTTYFSTTYTPPAAISYTDETVQPYTAVYMYKRTGLAKLN